MIDKNHAVVLFNFPFFVEKTTTSYYSACHNERQNERKSTLMSPAGLAFERKRCQYCQLSFWPQTQNSSFHHNVSLSLLVYSIPLLCLCHWTGILSARLSYLHQKCRQPAKGGRWVEGVRGRGAGREELCWLFLSCSQFKDNWIRDEITSIYVSESCDFIFHSLVPPPSPCFLGACLFTNGYNVGWVMVEGRQQ